MQKFEKEFQIRSYECDKDGFLRVVTLMNLLQDAADLSATSLGFGFDFCIQNKLAWMGTNYHLMVNRLPKVHDKIKITTWPSGENKFMALRDFVVTDENGAEIVKAISQWVLIDVIRKRPVSLSQHLPDCMYIDDHVLPVAFTKDYLLENVTCQKQFEARFDDIDLNRHVNNAVYPLWCVESLGTEFQEKFMPSEINISYKKECFCGQSVVVKTQITDFVTTHIVADATDPSKELALLCIHWQNK